MQAGANACPNLEKLVMPQNEIGDAGMIAICETCKEVRLLASMMVESGARKHIMRVAWLVAGILHRACAVIQSDRGQGAQGFCRCGKAQHAYLRKLTNPTCLAI